MLGLLLMKPVVAAMLLLAVSACSTPDSPTVAPDLLPTRFEVSVGGAMGSAYSVQLAGDHLRYTASSGPHFGHPRVRRIVPTAEQWSVFWREADGTEIWRWRRAYEVLPPKVVSDGSQWHIDIATRAGVRTPLATTPIRRT